MIDKALALLDGSSLAQCVLPHARALASAFAGEITLLRVVELEDKSTHSTQVDPVNWHLRKVEAQSYLNNLQHTWPTEESPPLLAMEEGTAVDRIIDYVHTHNPDVVILSTHGRSGVSSSSISSVAHKIIHLLTTSFMLVRARHSSAEGDKDKIHYQHIMAPLDGSRRAECVLPFALQLAAAHDAQLHLVHVVPQSEMIQSHPLSPEELDLSRQLLEYNTVEATSYLRHLAEKEELSISTHVLTESHVSDALITFSEKEQIDLVIMCAHGQSGGANRLYGSLVNNFIHYGSTPLFVLQDLTPEQIKSSITSTTTSSGPKRNITYAQPENWKPN